MELLKFVNMLAPTSSVSAALNNAGVVSLLLPVLSDSQKHHSHVVKTALSLLDLMLQCSTSVVTTFKDLGGPATVVDRIHCETVGLFKKEDTVMKDEDGTVPMKKLLESLLYLLSFVHSTCTPVFFFDCFKFLNKKNFGNAANSRRDVMDDKLIESLVTIFKEARAFGDRVFEIAVSILSDMIHQVRTFPSFFPSFAYCLSRTQTVWRGCFLLASALLSSTVSAPRGFLLLPKQWPPSPRSSAHCASLLTAELWSALPTL